MAQREESVYFPSLGRVATPVYDRESLTFKKEQLLVPESLLKRRLYFIRGEYDREDAPAEKAT